MNIGFLMRWPKGRAQIIGEELYAQSLCKELRQIAGVTSAEVYAPNFRPLSKLDIAIHLNDTLPGPYARKHVLYMQNFYAEGSDKILRELETIGYDGYAFFSEQLLTIHQSLGYSGIFLPLGADTTIFYPHSKIQKYEYDVVYVGNDIKGVERTMQYIHPAIHYKFGLFGNWNSSWSMGYPYHNVFAELSQGTITREESAIVYSSAKITLNCTGQDSVTWDAMNLRFFEALACKAFLISDKVPSAESKLKDGVIFTDGGQDLLDKIDYYLSRPAERQEIAENGYQYVIAHATVKARANQLYNYLQEIMYSK